MAPTVSELIAALDRLGTSQELTNLERLEVVAALRRNYRRLQRPFERVWETLLGQPHVYAATRTLMDLGLWRAWAAAGGGDKTLDELVGLCEKRCDPNLLRKEEEEEEEEEKISPLDPFPGHVLCQKTAHPCETLGV